MTSVTGWDTSFFFDAVAAVAFFGFAIVVAVLWIRRVRLDLKDAE